MDVFKDIIYLTLDISHQVDIAYNQNLKSLLALVNNNDKHKAIIVIKQLLVKKNTIFKTARLLYL